MGAAFLGRRGTPQGSRPLPRRGPSPGQRVPAHGSQPSLPVRAGHRQGHTRPGRRPPADGQHRPGVPRPWLRGRIGCEGPGWLLRGVYGGPAALADAVAPRAHRLFTQTVVDLSAAEGQTDATQEITGVEVHWPARG
ncbi:DUF3710 domain-containing protein [Streptomyces sp. NPDC007189]|uniref:DUF3710 domain-containing protein n=1 Tax=Streptomyces sp. NPDC007189 TaxID=3154315 RepID=UPI0034527D9F